MDKYNKVKLDLIEIFKAHVPEVDLSEETNLLNDTGMDSLNYISMIAVIEDKYDISFSDDDLELKESSTFGDLCNIVISLV